MKPGSKIIFNLFAITLGVGIIATTQILRTNGVETLTERVPDIFGTTGTYGDGTPSEGDKARTDRTVTEAANATELALDLPVVRRPTAPPALNSECSSARYSPDSIVIGDRLGLRIFERVALSQAQPGEAAPQTAQDVAYERLDLSGTFEVGGDGTVSLPLVGRVNVHGQTLTCAEAIVGRAMFEVTQTLTTANANFVSRPAILVRGAVRAPGSYQYSSGMIAETLLALAGSPSDGGVDAARHLLSLTAREAELETAVAGNILERRRIEAALADSRNLDLDPEEHVRLVAALGKQRLIAEENALKADIIAQEAKRARSETEINGAETAIADMLHQLAVVDEQLKEMSTRRDDVVELKNRRLISSAQVDSIIFNLMALERVRLDANGALLRLQSARNLAEQTYSVDQTTRRQFLTQMIRDLAEENDGLAAQLDALRSEISFAQSGATPARGQWPIEILINRPGVTGTERIIGALDSQLRPGDLVTVSVIPHAPKDDIALLERSRNATLPGAAEAERK